MSPCLYIQCPRCGYENQRLSNAPNSIGSLLCDGCHTRIHYTVTDNVATVTNTVYTPKKLWLLRPQKPILWPLSNPWNDYDTVDGFVIRAETEQEARQLAQRNAGTECGSVDPEHGTIPAWTDKRYSSCVELHDDGDTEIVMIDRPWTS